MLCRKFAFISDSAKHVGFGNEEEGKARLYFWIKAVKRGTALAFGLE